MASEKVKADRRYTKDHEWAKDVGSEVLVGITAFAVEQLGDVTLVNIDVKVGDQLTAGKAFGTIESVKTLSDMFSPVSGRVLRINGELEGRPEIVNEDCYERGYMLAVEPSDRAELDKLLDASAYTQLLATASH